MAGPESRIRSQIKAEITKLGGLCVLLHGSAYSGVGRSDLWAVVAGIPFAIEVKTPVGVVTKVQKLFLLEARRAGACAFVARDPHSARRAILLRLKGRTPYMDESNVGDLDLGFMADLEASLGQVVVPEPEPVVVEPEPTIGANHVTEFKPEDYMPIAGESAPDYVELVNSVRTLTATINVLNQTVSMLLDMQVMTAKAVAAAFLGVTPAAVEEEIVPTETEAPRRRRSRGQA